MPSILRLSRQVADLIAAGEVVERPASAAKELIENSIDADASQITVEIQGGGIVLLRVTDNGKGIPASEVETAFLRHATSKLETKEDLEEIITMGFRGEALAAICAVSKVEILTKTEDADFGRLVVLAGGQILSNEEAGCPTGTTIVLRELFYNTPARHKFLKKDATEAGLVQAVCQKAALARPDIAFRFIRNGESVLQTPGDGQLRSVIYTLFGGDAEKSLLPVYGEHAGIKVEGFVGTPESARGSRAMQHFLVNGRPVKNITLQSALEQAFRKHLVSGRYPSAFLHITVNPRLLDVNIHPAKTEIKFAREKDAFDAAYYAVKTALAQNRPAELSISKPPPSFAQPPSFSAAPERDTAILRENPAVVRADGAEKPWENLSPIYKNHKNSPKDDGIISLASLGILNQPAPTPTDFAPEPETLPAQEEVFPPFGETESPPWRFVGEAMGTYIIAEQSDTLCLMDKHAAHERMLYERLKQEASGLPAQLLLDPPVLHLSPAETAVLLENQGVLLRLGFEIEAFGGSSLRLITLPSALAEEENPAVLLSELADQLAKGKEPAPEALDRLLATIACKAAVRAKDAADPAELMRLFEAVIADENLRHCPHGRPLLVFLTKKELEKQFRRQV